MHSEPFLHFELRSFEQLRRKGYAPGIVYDIGASNGQWSRAVSAIFPRAHYHLFEPLAGRFSPYSAQLQDNLARARNFTLHAMALGNVNGSAPIYVSPDGYGSSLLERKLPELVKVDVPCSRLEDYVAAHQLPAPNLIKIDVQGFEGVILEGAGALVTGADILFLETWLERGYGPNTVLLTELVERLRCLDFFLMDVGAPYYGSLGQLISVDAFFYSRRLAEKLKAGAMKGGAAA